MFHFHSLVNHTTTMAKTRKCPPGVHPTQMPDDGDDASSQHFDTAVAFERGSDAAPDEKTSSSARRLFGSIPPPAVDNGMESLKYERMVELRAHSQAGTLRGNESSELDALHRFFFQNLFADSSDEHERKRLVELELHGKDTNELNKALHKFFSEDPSLPSTKEYAPTVISIRSSLAANEDDSVASTTSSSSSHIDRPFTYDEEAELAYQAEHDHVCNCRWEDDAYDLWTQRRNKVAICIRCNLHFNLHKRLPAWSMLAGGKPPAEKRPRSNPHACTEMSSPLKPSQLVRIDLTTEN